ncbi:MAG: hypothetical protein ACLUAO_05755 [Streptococcus sp.]
MKKPLEQQEVPMATTTIFFIKTITFLEKSYGGEGEDNPSYSSPEGKNNDLYLGKILNTFLV